MMDEEAIGHRLVFVGGLHRSGTTHFARALSRHPDVSGFADTGATEDEGQHLQTIYPAAREFGGPGKFAFHPDAHLTESSELVSRANAARLVKQWGTYWDGQMPIWLEKSPPNLIRTRFLQALFPDARFIVVLRHPVVVALATSKWTRYTSFDRLVEHWLVAHELFAQDAPHIQHLKVVHYEDLVLHTERTLREITAFLSLKDEAPAESWDRRRSEEYVRRWSTMRTSRLPWRFRMARRLRDRYAERLEALGYAMDDITRPVPPSTAPQTRGRVGNP